MTIKVTYNVTDVYMSQSVSPVYINVSYSDGGASGGGVWGSITGTLSNQTDLQTALDAKLDESTIDGGTEGQILSKASATDFDFAWINNYAKYLATNVRNQTGSTIAAFQVVYISGATGNKPLISLADADTEVTSSKTYGVTATAIANNGTGDVVTAGELSGIDTSAFNEGDLLWLSTTAGGVVTSPPAEPAHAVFIGYVVRSHPTLGTIDVSIQNGYELNELHGVQITTPTDNQGLFYNATSTLWENKSITTALGYTPVPTTRNITINGVTYDLSADRTWTIAAGISGSGASGQVTYWTGASAVSGSNNLFWNSTTNCLGIGTTSTGTASRKLSLSSTSSTYLQFINTSGRTVAIGNDTVGSFIVYDDTAANYRLVVSNNGNLLLGTSTDSGQRLQVYGDTLLRGSGATSATTALTVQNSDGSSILRVNNAGWISLGNSSVNPLIYSYTTSGQSNDITGTNLGFYARTSTQSAVNGRFWFGGAIMTHTSAATFNLYSNGNFSPTSGTGTFTEFVVIPTINQTGGANGITRGLYVNPTLTSAADFRAIETSAGNVLFGSNFFWDNTNGRLGIGTNVPASPLHISGSGASAAGRTWIRIQNTSANSAAGVQLMNASNRTASIQYAANGYGTGETLSFFTDNDYPVLFGTNGVAVSGGAAYIAFSAGGYLNEAMRVTGTKNLLIGTTTDGGQRLQVIGDTLLRGSGATSATTALTVQNSSSTNLLTVRNDGLVTISNGLLQSAIVTSSATSTRLAINNTNANPNAGIQLQTNAVGNWSLANYIPGGGTNASFVFYNDRTNTDSLFINGDNNNVGIRTNAPTARLDIPASVTTAASLRIRSGTAPTSPNDGDIWFDGTDIKMRIGGVTKTFTLI